MSGKNIPLYNELSKHFSIINTDNDLEVEIGDSKQPDIFQPQFKIKKWDNEANVSFRYLDADSNTPIQVGEKIKLVGTKNECDLYELEDGYEFEITLKEKPKTNKVNFSMQTKGLEFYYQTSLKEEYLSGKGDKLQRPVLNGMGEVIKWEDVLVAEAVLSEYSVTDKNGLVLRERPANIVGSYAVYHTSKRGDYTKLGGKNYGKGKIGHIYRPKIEDSAGNWVWGDLNIDDKKSTLTVTISQEFLENAVYPVKHAAGLTFGYTTIGGSNGGYGPDYFDGTKDTVAANGVVDSVSVYGKRWIASSNFKGLVVLTSNLNILTNGISPATAVNSDTPQWWTSTYSTKPTVTNGTSYIVGVIAGATNGMYHYYDAGDVGRWYQDATNSYTTPTNPTDASSYNYLFSFYATYTATSDIKKMAGVTQANIKKVAGVAIASVKKAAGVSN